MPTKKVPNDTREAKDTAGRVRVLYASLYRPTLFSKYTWIHYINYMLLVVPNTKAALLCWSAMDTLWRRNERDLLSCVMLF